MDDITHRAMTLMLQLGVILFAARLGNLAFQRLRLPGVLGELCAGMVVGPALLGAVALPGFPTGLFGALAEIGAGAFPVSPELYGVSALAAIVLLFMVGLETDLKLFLRYSVAGGLTGCGGVVVSFFAGAGLTAWLSPWLLGVSIGIFDPLSLMVGVVFTATSVGIPSRILAERRKLESPEGVTILSGAVIDDVLGVILLALVLGLTGLLSQSQTGAFPWAQAGRIALKTIGVWIIAMALGLSGARYIGNALKWFRHRSVIAVMAFGLALIVAGVFEAVGLAMIVGAYVTGLSLSRTDLRHVILERLHGLQVMLVPVFFAVMGMLVDVRQLAQPRMLGLGFLFFGVALLAKLFGAGLPPMLAGFNWRGGFRIGAGMAPRGEVTLLMAGAGLAAGLLTSELMGILVVMTLLTSLAAPALMALSFRSAQSGLRRPVVNGGETEIVYTFPSAAVVEMLTQKLVAAFESEGFFVHLLNRDAGIYQLRMNDLVIGFRKDDRQICFQCRARSVSFVRTAMVEVIAELEETLRDLRKPLDTQSIQRGVGVVDAETETASPAQVALRKYLDPGLMCPRLSADSREGVIEELLDRICAADLVVDRAAVLSSILNREQNLSTGLQDGIAIPHARTDAVKRLVCAIGLKPQGVDFDSVDGLPARIVVLLLAPKRAGVPYLQFISRISQVLNEQGRSALLACDTAEDMFAVLTGAPRAPRSFLGALRPARAEGAILEAFEPGRVLIGVEAKALQPVLDTLLALCGDALQPASIDAVRVALLERERIMSTAVGNGLALPHARTDAVASMICAVGVLSDGVDFRAPDGQPVRIVILTLIPPEATLAYPKLLATLTRALNAEGRQAMLKAESAEGALAVLRRGI